METADFIGIAQRLGLSGLCVYPDFLSKTQLCEVSADHQKNCDLNLFERAGTGQGQEREVRNQVRRDEIHWLERATQTSAQEILWSQLDALKQALNRTLFLGLKDFEGHYATYPPGGFYKRHLDRFKNDNAANSSRMVSIVVYLNKDWQPQDGGKLRVYDSQPDSVSHTDVNPQGGSLVCFLSGESEHEVLLSHTTRRSFVGWFKR